VISPGVGEAATEATEANQAPTRSAAPEVIDLGTARGDQQRGVGHQRRRFHPFLWRNGRMLDLGTVEGQSFSGARAVNDRGEIVGSSGGPVVWRGGVPSTLRKIPGADDFGEALDVNRRGDIVGYWGMTGGPSINRAVVWRRGVPTDLGLEGEASQALGLNDRGQVVALRLRPRRALAVER
jgi:uncharacterized membrane protein